MSKNCFDFEIDANRGHEGRCEGVVGIAEQEAGNKEQLLGLGVSSESKTPLRGNSGEMPPPLLRRVHFVRI